MSAFSVLSHAFAAGTRAFMVVEHRDLNDTGIVACLELAYFNGGTRVDCRSG